MSVFWVMTYISATFLPTWYAEAIAMRHVLEWLSKETTLRSRSAWAQTLYRLLQSRWGKHVLIDASWSRFQPGSLQPTHSRYVGAWTGTQPGEFWQRELVAASWDGMSCSHLSESSCVWQSAQLASKGNELQDREGCTSVNLMAFSWVMMTVLMMMKMMVIVWLRALPVSIVASSACRVTRKAEEQCWQELGIGLKS